MEEKMVREARFELAQGCPRQPLKLVRLPFRHSRKNIPVNRILHTLICEISLALRFASERLYLLAFFSSLRIKSCIRKIW